MAKVYNPYDDVLKIVQQKGNYNTAKVTGGNYNQYRDAAVPYYNNLSSNGYGGVADELAGVDYTGALDVLGRYKPTSKVADSYLGDVGVKEGGYYGESAKKLTEASRTPQVSKAVNDILDSYKGTSGLADRLSEEHYGTGKAQLDRINNFDVTAQPYYDKLLASYKLEGADAARGALAGGAAGNGGNIDSYAAANANRQQLAFTDAGVKAALAQANQNEANWQNLYGMMSADIANTGARGNEALGYAVNMHGIDSAERQNGVNAAAALAQSEMAQEGQRYGYDAQKYLSDNELAGVKYQADRGLEGQKYGFDVEKYLSDNSLAGQKYTSDNNLAGVKAQAGASVEAQRLASDASKYGAMQDYLAAVAGNESKERISANEIAAAQAEAERADKLQRFLAGNERSQQFKQMEQERKLAEGENETKRYLAELSAGGGTPSGTGTGNADMMKNYADIYDSYIKNQAVMNKEPQSWSSWYYNNVTLPSEANAKNQGNTSTGTANTNTYQTEKDSGIQPIDERYLGSNVIAAAELVQEGKTTQDEALKYLAQLFPNVKRDRLVGLYEAAAKTSVKEPSVKIDTVKS